MDVNEAAAILGVSPRRVRSLIASRALTARMITGRWVIPRRSVVGFSFLERRGGRPLSCLAAWRAIASGEADPYHTSRCLRRGRPVRLLVPWSVWLETVDELGGLLSGTGAAVELLKPHIHNPDVSLPPIGVEHDMYLPEQAEDEILRLFGWDGTGESDYGSAVVRFVEPAGWEIAREAARLRDSLPGIPLAPPLAVAMDLMLHSSGRDQAAAHALVTSYRNARCGK